MGYDDWNKLDEDDEDELQDQSYFESKKDVILFAIDCSESMLELYEDPVYQNAKTCHAFVALEAAMEIQKRKVITGPNDSVGIMLFNTTCTAESTSRTGSEIKKNCYIYQPMAPLSAPKIQELKHLLDEFRQDSDTLASNFPPLLDGKRVPMGDVFTSCNWILRDGAPKTAAKRVFLITDTDEPHTNPQLATAARTTFVDLKAFGATVEPFFISTKMRPFDVNKFYSSVLVRNSLADEDYDEDYPSVLPESISISRIEDLLAQMRFHEVPKRAAFSIPFKLADGFTIGVKGYNLITEQRKGTYRYFADLGERMEVAVSKTTYWDEKRQAEIDKSRMVYGLGGSAAADGEDDTGGDTRVVKAGQRPFYTADEVRQFRTLGLEPGLKLLGFKDRKWLRFEDSVKHSVFIYPDELTYSGSKRTFSALLKSMVKKKKIGLALGLTRRNSSPIFYALLPQEEKIDPDGETDPPGIHLIPLPFADDIRAAPIETACRASEETKDAAVAWISKLSVKTGSYPPDTHPNPALAFHNAQLQATAFGEEFDADLFEDVCAPKHDVMHKRAGKLWEAWKEAVANDENAAEEAPVEKKRGTKRKADAADGDFSDAEIRSRHAEGTLGKLTVDQLKTFLRSKGQPVSGRKDALIERVEEILAGGICRGDRLVAHVRLVKNSARIPPTAGCLLLLSMASVSSSLTQLPVLDETPAAGSAESTTDAQDHPGRGPSAIPEDKKEELIINAEENWEDDPLNPRNWPVSKKWASAAVASFYTFVSPLSSSIMAPGIPELAIKYHITNDTIVAMTLSIFLISFAIAPLFLAPLSEMYGRRWVLNICNLLTIGFNIGCAFAPNTGAFLAFRFLVGFSGSAPIACGGGVISDLFSERDRAAAMALFSLGPLIGPVIGPIVGGFVTQEIGIKYVFIIVAGLGGIASAVGIPILRETYAPTIRLRRAKKAVDPEKAAAQHPHLLAEHGSKLHYLWVNLSRPAILMFRSLVCFMLSLYMAFMYGIYYLMFTTFSKLFAEVYGFNTGTGGLTYIGLGFGFVLATAISAKYGNDSYLYLAKKNGGKGTPEMRVPALIFGSLFVPIGLLQLVRVVRGSTHPLDHAHHRHGHLWIRDDVYLVCVHAPYEFWLLMHFFSLPIQLYLVDTFTYAASALAGASVFRSLLGFAFPLFGDAMYSALGTGGGNSLLGGLAVALGIPFPIYLYYHGAAIRAKSSLSR
ncbi:SAP domain-containing protein [Mycena kentingensis (nom. inval.)]|nr:SAP domain-containing protein [Mycena kentingensis (nom. inval.)]